MLRGALLVMVLWVAASRQQITGPGCEPFAGTPAACASLISGFIYVPAGVTQSAIAANVTTAFTFLSLVDTSCASALTSFTCAASFRPCDSSSEPQPICTSVCVNTAATCATTAASSSVRNCATFTDSLNDLIFEDVRGNVTCFNPAAANVSKTCPYGFVFDGSSCAALCPLPPFEKPEHFRRYDIINRLLTSLSLLCELFFLIPWTYHGIRTRNLHTRYQYWYLVTVTMISLGFAMSFGGARAWRCVDEFTPRTAKTDGKVILQAFLFITGLISSTAWVSSLIAHLFFKTVLLDKGVFGAAGTLFGVPEWIVYHVISWSSGALIFIIGTGLQTWEVAIPGIYPTPAAIPHLWYSIGLLPIPALFFAFTSCTLFAILIARVFALAKVRGLRTQLRLCLMCLWFTFTATFCSANSLRVTSRSSKIVAAYYAYIGCLFQNGTDCVYRHGIQEWTAVVSMILLTSIGVVFMGLFFNQDVLQQWRDLLRGVPFVRPKTFSSTGSPSHSHSHSRTATGASASQL